VDWSRIETFVGGWLAGVVTPLAAEFLRRRLFDRPQLQVSSELGLVPDAGETAPVLFISAVNTSDFPIILTATFYGIRYADQELIWSEQDLPGLSGEHKFPIKLGRHEEYTQAIELGPWIEHFLDLRLKFYGDSSGLDYKRLEFDVALLDTTKRHWQAKPVKLSGSELQAVRNWFASRAKSQGMAPVEPNGLT